MKVKTEFKTVPVNTFDIVDIPEDLKGNQQFNEVFLIERALWNSTGKIDAAVFIKKFVHPNCLVITPSDAGFWITTNRDNYIKISDNSPEWMHCVFKNIEFKKLSDDIVVILYNAVATASRHNRYGVMVSTTFQKDINGQWKVLETHHSMPYSPGLSKDGYDDALSQME